jgi:hypothetical protein
MANRTQIVCLHEGKKGRSIDPLFIRKLIKTLDPVWIRPWKGNNVIRTQDCGGRSSLIAKLAEEIFAAMRLGGDTTIIVWADVDDNMAGPEALKQEFWKNAQAAGVTADQFERVVFALAEDRIENWIEFLNTGKTDESQEGPRVKKDSEAVDAAKKLAKLCLIGAPIENIPPSLEWSCRNWRALVSRMQ